jgi:hypothetical protein
MRDLFLPLISRKSESLIERFAINVLSAPRQMATDGGGKAWLSLPLNRLLKFFGRVADLG